MDDGFPTLKGAHVKEGKNSSLAAVYELKVVQLTPAIVTLVEESVSRRSTPPSFAAAFSNLRVIPIQEALPSLEGLHRDASKAVLFGDTSVLLKATEIDMPRPARFRFNDPVEFVGEVGPWKWRAATNKYDRRA